MGTSQSTKRPLTFRALRSQGDLARLILVALTLSATVLLFPASTVYFNNVHDYRLGFAEMLLLALLMVALLAAALSIGGWLLPPRWRPHALVLMTMASIGFWLQANLLVWNYGILDGSEIPWARHHARGMLEVLIWLALLVVGWRHARQLATRASTIAGAVLAIQLSGLLMAAWQAPTAPSHHRYSIDTSGQFSLSPEQNLVVIVLDAFQSDVFQQILDENPQFHDVFDGFHYFRNALAGYAKTYPSIPLMLSGQWYENDEAIDQFMARAYMQGSLPRQLKDAGWDVRLYPHIERTLHFDEALADNFIDQVTATERRVATARFIDIGLFRALPHFVKPWWLNDYAWRLQGMLPPPDSSQPTTDSNNTSRSQHTHSAMRWLEDMQASSTLSDDTAAFRFYHLFVPHAPFLLNEKLEMELLPIDREGFYRHSIAAVKLMQHYLQQLQSLDIYDNTTIAIVSEHGGGEYHAGVQAERLGQPAADSTELPAVHHASGLPLVLIKPPAARGRLQTSDAPVSLGDLAHTLATASGLQAHELPGRNMFDIAADQPRERRFLFYHFDGFDVQYLPDMLEYRVSGHSWLAAHWQASGEILQSAGEARPQDNLAPEWLGVNEQLDFDAQGNGQRFLASGWSLPESEGTWSDARRADIRLPLSEAIDEDDLELHLTLRPFLSEDSDPPLRSQQVTVLVNSVPTTRWDVTELEDYSVTIDADIHVGSDELQLELILHDATSPAALLLSEDLRQLGVQLQQLRLSHGANYRMGATIDFGINGNAEPYIDEGWSQAEAGQRWSDGPRASLQIPLSSRVRGDLRLSFAARAFVSDPELPAQTVALTVNGQPLADWSMTGAETQQVTIPADLLSGQRLLQIDFRLPDASSPLALGLSADNRVLGIALRELRIEHID